MDDFLSQLMHQLGNRQPAQPRQQARPMQQKAMPVRQSPAQAYEQAMANGDYNSPAVIGVDPAQFGYPADEMVESTPTRVKYPRSNPDTGYYKAGPTSPAQMRQQPQQQDPLAQLRQLLGF